MLNTYRFFITSILVHTIVLLALITASYLYNKPTDTKIQITLVPPINKSKGNDTTVSKQSSQQVTNPVAKTVKKDLPKPQPATVKEPVLKKSLNQISQKKIDFSKQDKSKIDTNKQLVTKNKTLNKVSDDKKNKSNFTEKPVQITEKKVLEKQQVEKPVKQNVVMKNQDFLKLLESASSNIKEEKEIEDILQSTELSNEDKQALQSNLAGCALYLSDIQDYDIVINLKLTMNQDATISKVNVLSIKTKSDSIDKNILENRVKDMFKLPNCSKLTLPEGKYYFWKDFTVSLTLKSFFE